MTADTVWAPTVLSDSVLTDASNEGRARPSFRKGHVMNRTSAVVLTALIGSLTAPSVALAAEGGIGSPPLRIGVSLAGLVVAVVLLVEALGVRKAALGGAIAERMSYVVLAIVCLAGSALARWTQNFVIDVTQEQVQLASELLVIAAMGLLAAYFFSVRSALQSYLKAMTGSEMLSTEPAQPQEADEEA